ncbi:hypothetical protein H8F24_12600 [Synechococcus sp. CBW1002]|uniref:hypothetical protein n=1 Tax=Synechococcus sp. CBW1002 TaxID=1353134 RepID=UPI0018CCB879|nr:hypothetical protein [Synechococcus sp. CBW1002]QPN58953.1 hypothetical protein H8F24_12600 [Synechococcus sp. CBW1002]
MLSRPLNAYKKSYDSGEKAVYGEAYIGSVQLYDGTIVSPELDAAIYQLVTIAT